MITVVSTSYNPPAAAQRRCLDSVAKQITSHEHIYLDASTQTPPLSHFENIIEAVRDLPPDRVVVSLDGDDWLFASSSLAHVERAHNAGAMVTWGSFIYADGRPGFARELTYEERLHPRKAPWVATHLKSFRAGLFREILPQHLQGPDGQWLVHARDLAVMYPLIEMAGPKAVYIPEVLCVYNYVNSTEHKGGPEMLAAERESVRYVRGLPPYQRLK